MSPPLRFVGRIYCLGIIRYVNLPDALSGAFRAARVPVRGTCNGVPFRSTLMPRGGGHRRLALNGAVRRAAGGVDVGDEVLLTVARTAKSPVPPIPPDLGRALAARRGGRPAFEAWPPSKRLEVMRWLVAARRPETRTRRLARILEVLGLAGTREGS